MGRYHCARMGGAIERYKSTMRADAMDGMLTKVEKHFSQVFAGGVMCSMFSYDCCPTQTMCPLHLCTPIC